MTVTMDIETADAEDRPGAAPGRRDRSGPGPWTWVGVAVLAVLAGYFVLGREPAPPAPPDGPRPVPSVTAALAAGPNQRQYLGVTTICAPVTDGRHTLAVSFEVSNVSDFPVQVNSVDGVLPDGGLRQRGPATLGGDCRDAGSQPPAHALLSGESRFYTLVFDLPRRCPAQYPIQTRIGFVAGGFTESSLSLLCSDLSVPDFDTCTGTRATTAPG